MNPRSSSSYAACSSLHSSSTRFTGTSRSCARSCGSTGSSATIRIASMARASAFMSMSSFVPVDEGQRVHPRSALDGCGIAADPDDRDVGEVAELLDLDQTLLVQLEHCEEADDDFEALEQAARELAERDAVGPRQLVEQLFDRVGDTRPDGRDVIEI